MKTGEAMYHIMMCRGLCALGGWTVLGGDILCIAVRRRICTCQPRYSAPRGSHQDQGQRATSDRIFSINLSRRRASALTLRTVQIPLGVKLGSTRATPSLEFENPSESTQSTRSSDLHEDFWPDKPCGPNTGSRRICLTRHLVARATVPPKDYDPP